MATYHATIMHGKRDTEGRYEFTGPDDLMSRTPLQVMRALMTHVEAEAHIGHIEYAVNAAMKARNSDVVTVLGELEFESGDHQPFVCMIST